MEIKRDIYLNKLIGKKHNGFIKVVTGIRRCGKSYLLFNLFKDHLLAEGTDEQHSKLPLIPLKISLFVIRMFCILISKTRLKMAVCIMCCWMKCSF